jgi:N-methylhydantoinase A
VNASDISYFGHGTTVATNALIQHRGARTGLITSDGFRDLLEIGRQKRPELYDLQADKPPVLVERQLRLEVPERLRYDGHVETVLDEAAVHGAVRMLRDADVEAIAICFLYSFLNPANEATACTIVAEEFPEVFVCVSHDVAPEFREYERQSRCLHKRASTTAQATVRIRWNGTRGQRTPLRVLRPIGLAPAAFWPIVTI